MEFFNPSNAFDAEGLTRLTETIETRKKARNDIEQDTMIQIRNKNLDTERQALEIDRDLEYARLEQGRELEVKRAGQRADVAREKALKEQEAERAQIQAREAVERARISSERAIAAKIRHEVEAEGLTLMNQAANLLTPEARQSALRRQLVDKLEGIIRESVKPMERIEGIRILHVDGLGGGGGGRDTSGANFA